MAPQEQFDDPALKAAISRSWPRESAPPALRQRIQSLMAQPAPIPPEAIPATPQAPAMPIRPLAWWQNPLHNLAAAAILILVIGGGWYYYQGLPQQQYPQQYATVLAPTLTSALVRAHDRCCNASDHHHVQAPRSDFQAINQALTSQLNRPVLATSLNDGWEFKGAAVCRVGGSPTAHLIYQRGTQTISVFSLPREACGSGPASSSYQLTTDDGHHVAGFVRGDGLYCVVGSCPQGDLDLSQVMAVRNQLRNRMQ